MTITGTCIIQVTADQTWSPSAEELRQFKNKLTEAFSDILDDYLDGEGIENQEMHSCMVEDFDVEK